MYCHKNGTTLRKVEREDLGILKHLKNESWFGTHRTAIVNMDDQIDWYDKSSRSSDCLYLIASRVIDVVAPSPPVPVGIYKISNIDWISRRYDSAHDVFAGFRGFGFGRLVLEAGVDFGFEILNMNRLDTEVLENNSASTKNVLYAGYIKEGVKRKAIYKSGFWLDSVVYGILREEWINLVRVKSYGGVCNTSYKPMVSRDSTV